MCKLKEKKNNLEIKCNMLDRDFCILNSLSGCYTSLRFKATRTKIDYFYCRASFLPKQNILRLEITVYDFLFAHDFHALQNRIRKASNQIQAEALIVVFFN
jgi:hypothetical protein